MAAGRGNNWLVVCMVAFAFCTVLLFFPLVFDRRPMHTHEIYLRGSKEAGEVELGVGVL